jgi:hypothetical protein
LFLLNKLAVDVVEIFEELIELFLLIVGVTLGAEAEPQRLLDSPEGMLVSTLLFLAPVVVSILPPSILSCISAIDSFFPVLRSGFRPGRHQGRPNIPAVLILLP